jgi:hypothetical protein
VRRQRERERDRKIEKERDTEAGRVVGKILKLQ